MLVKKSDVLYVFSLKIEVGNMYCPYIKFNLLSVDVTRVGCIDCFKFYLC